MVQTIPAGGYIGPIGATVLCQLRTRARHTPAQAGPDGDVAIESLPTWYGGTTFRSALEACWAATLDTFDITWEYEPQSIALPSGAVYVPDFWLPRLGTWIEVKGHGVPRVEKAHELARTRACACTGRCSCPWPGGELVLVGHPSPPAGFADRGRHHGRLMWSCPAQRNAYLAACTACGLTGWCAARAPMGCRACRRPWRDTRAHGPGDERLTLVNAAGFTF